MVKAFELQISNPTAKLILVKLADNANDKGYCFPSIEYIAKHCSVHPRTVKRQIKNLAEQGYLEVKPRFNNNIQRSNEYHLQLDSPLESRGDNLTSHKDQQSPITVNATHGGGDTGSPGGVTEDHPESLDLINHKDKEILKTCAKSTALVENDEVDCSFENLWKAWHNKKNRIAAKKAFKTVCRKSKAMPQFIVDSLKQDILVRLDSQQLGFDKMMLSSYLNGERWLDDITDNKPKAENKRIDPLLAAMGMG